MHDMAVEYGLERMNNELSSWMRADLTPGSGGEAASMPFVATRGFDSVVWSRLYSQEEWGSERERGMACMALASVLDAVGAARLVVGHTPQMGGANRWVLVTRRKGGGWAYGLRNERGRWGGSDKASVLLVCVCMSGEQCLWGEGLADRRGDVEWRSGGASAGGEKGESGRCGVGVGILE